MKIKLFCPLCGRCIGEGLSSDNSGIIKVLTVKPDVLKKKQGIHLVKCCKCKNPLYISMEFVDEEEKI